MINIIQIVKSKILESEFIKSVAVLFSGNIIANIISFASIPIISRLYSDEALGNYAILVSTASIISAISSLGLNSAIMLPIDDNKSRKIFTVAFIIQLTISSIIFFILVFFSPLYEIYTIDLNYLVSLFLVYIYTVVSGIFSLLSIYVNKLKKNRVLFWNVIINSSILLIITIPLGFLGFGSLGFMIAAILSFTIASLQMLYKVNPFTKINSFNELFKIISQYKKFIFYQFPSNLIGIFTLQIPNQIFSHRFGNALLGNYAMCERALGTPIRLVGGPINTIYFRHSAQIFNNNNHLQLSKFTYSLITKILIASLIPVLIIFNYSEVLFTFILGNSWSSVGEVAKILIVPYILMFCTTSISYCLVVIQKQDINFYLSLFQTLIITGSIYIGINLYGDFIGTLRIFAIGNSIFQLVTLIITFYYLKYHFKKFLYLSILYSIVVLFLYLILV